MTLFALQVEKELAGIMGRLNNPKFVEKAAAAYLAEVQGQAADAQDRLNGIEAKIQQVQQLQQAGAAAA
jgi:valyl-tRNA synthetase